MTRMPWAPRRLVTALVTAVLVAGSAFTTAAEDAERFADASRLVAIGGSLTEIVYALGEQDKLVARDSTAVYPPEAMALPDVGYMRQLSPEGVMSVNPSAILLLEGSGPPEAVEVIRKASIPVVTVPDTYTSEGIAEKIRIVGHALGVDAKADALAAEVKADLAKARTATAGVGERKKVLFVLSTQGGRLLASGSETAASGIIEMAGGANAVEGFTGYKQISDEAVYEARPDVVLMMDRGGDHDASADELFARPALAGTPAARERALVKIDGAWLLGFGPRTASAVRELSAALYGASVVGN